MTTCERARLVGAASRFECSGCGHCLFVGFRAARAASRRLNAPVACDPSEVPPLSWEVMQVLAARRRLVHEADRLRWWALDDYPFLGLVESRGPLPPVASTAFPWMGALCRESDAALVDYRKPADAQCARIVAFARQILDSVLDGTSDDPAYEGYYALGTLELVGESGPGSTAFRLAVLRKALDLPDLFRSMEEALDEATGALQRLVVRLDPAGPSAPYMTRRPSLANAARHELADVLSMRDAVEITLMGVGAVHGDLQRPSRGLQESISMFDSIARSRRVWQLIRYGRPSLIHVIPEHVSRLWWWTGPAVG